MKSAPLSVNETSADKEYENSGRIALFALLLLIYSEVDLLLFARFFLSAGGVKPLTAVDICFGSLLLSIQGTTLFAALRGKQAFG